MDYEQFLKQVAEDLKYSIPNATIEISDVVKVQGESYRGISVRMNDSPVADSMNLRGAYERLMDGADYHDILQNIHDQTMEAVSQGRGFDLDLVQDYGKAKERLCMEVIPIKGNEELLTGIPHTVMEDLAVIHRIDIDDHAVVTVTNNLLDHFGISEEQLHADALVSAPGIRPAKILPMHGKATFLYFMSLCEKNRSNYLSSYAYYKNFFDRISADMAFKSGRDEIGRAHV